MRTRTIPGPWAPALLTVCLLGPAAAELPDGASAGLSDADPTVVAWSADDFRVHAETLAPEHVRTLLAASQQPRVVKAAGPEVRGALQAIAERHPDLRARRAAAARATKLERPARLVALNRTVARLRGQRAGGVEVWAAVARQSVELHLAEGRSSQEALDLAVLDLGFVFNGGGTLKKNLEFYRDTLGKLPGSDSKLPELLATFPREDLNFGSAGSNVDSGESDFRADLHDGTANQVFHSNFFVVLGYLVGDKDPALSHLVNLKHETLDRGGRSLPDYRASAVGLEAGRRIRALREAGGDPRALPAIIGAAFSETPWVYGEGQTFDGVPGGAFVSQVAEASRERAKHPSGSGVVGRTADTVQRGVIRALGSLD